MNEALEKASAKIKSMQANFGNLDLATRCNLLYEIAGLMAEACIEQAVTIQKLQAQIGQPAAA
jgi:hypothetical protein